MPNPFEDKRISAQQRIHELIEASKLADEAGLDVFAVGESHQDYFNDFATLDLSSNGRAEIVAGRGSRVGAYRMQ